MEILEHVPLAERTTLGVGGAARWFVETANEAEVLAAVRFARLRGVPHFLLGGGSNVLVADAGFPGVVIRYGCAGLKWNREGGGRATVVADSGASWEAVVDLAVANDLAGIECLAGIPGLVGGTPVQNVGAYGQEVSSSIASVRAIDLGADRIVQLDASQCGFLYRSSLFNREARGRYAITQVVYSLAVGGSPHLHYRDLREHFSQRSATAPTLRETAAAVREIRSAKGMLAGQAGPNACSAGSFFKNPVVPAVVVQRIANALGVATAAVPNWPSQRDEVKLPAAWLIERAGFPRGYRLGRAGLSTQHVLALVNVGGASAAEILALRDLVVAEVYRRFAITLEQEPVMLG